MIYGLVTFWTELHLVKPHNKTQNVWSLDSFRQTIDRLFKCWNSVSSWILLKRLKTEFNIFMVGFNHFHALDDFRWIMEDDGI